MKENHPKKKNKAIEYFEDSFQELKKVTWPTKNQAVRLTLLVLGFCFVSAIVIGAMDAIFNYGHQQLVNYASIVSPPTEADLVNSADQGNLPLTREAPVTGEAPLKVTATTTPTTTQQ